jgi:hypothetical protein
MRLNGSNRHFNARQIAADNEIAFKDPFALTDFLLINLHVQSWSNCMRQTGNRIIARGVRRLKNVWNLRVYIRSNILAADRRRITFEPFGHLKHKVETIRNVVTQVDGLLSRNGTADFNSGS